MRALAPDRARGYVPQDMIHHTTLDGDVLTIRADADTEAFLTAARDLAARGGDADALRAMMYGSANPMLTAGPAGPEVTPEVILSPAWRLLEDLVEQAMAQKPTSLCTMPLAEAAKLLGGQARAEGLIALGLIATHGQGDQVLCDERTVRAAAAFADRAEGRALSFGYGSAPGISFRVKVPGQIIGRSKADAGRAQVYEGRVYRWSSAAVLIIEERDGRKTARLEHLRASPDGAVAHLRVGPFYVSGPFERVGVERNMKRALDAWMRFEPRL